MARRTSQIPLQWAQRTYDQLVNSPKRELKIFTDREGGVAAFELRQFRQCRRLYRRLGRRDARRPHRHRQSELRRGRTMNIIGPDALAFGVDDVAACKEYLTAFGLKPVGVDETGGFFEALDGTGVLIRGRTDPRPAAAARDRGHAAPDRLWCRRPSDSRRDRRRAREGPAGQAPRRLRRRSERRPRLRPEVSGDEEARARHAARDRQCAGFASPARPQQDRRLGRDAGCAAHAFACRLLRAGHSPARRPST